MEILARILIIIIFLHCFYIVFVSFHVRIIFSHLKDLSSFENPCFRNLADEVPNMDLSSKTKKENTIKVYDYAY